MRIIGGRLGGRRFNSPPGHKTHPMSEKVRGALFNALGDIEGLNVLDAFAGSGAMSFEAISRGASHSVAVDSGTGAHKTVKTNADLLGIKPRVTAIRANVSGWSDQNPQMQFDIILCDPPYDQFRPGLIQKLVPHLKDSGIFILSLGGRNEIPVFDGLDMIEQKDYGDAQIIYYKKAV